MFDPWTVSTKSSVVTSCTGSSKVATGPVSMLDGGVNVAVGAASSVNDADTDRAASMLTVHVSSCPAQSPPHPWNCEPASGVAESVTEVLAAKFAAHATPPLPQEIPAGELVTVPPEDPPSDSDSAYPNTASTRLFPTIFTVQPAAPVQARAHVTSTAPGFGVAVMLSVDPAGASNQIVDRSGNPAAETTTPFRAATSLDQSDLAAGWTWRTIRDRGAAGGSYSIDDVPGASAALAFTGPSVRWDTISGPDEGKARVVIDGTTHGVFDLSGGAVRFVHRRFGALGAGPHLIRVLPLGRRGAHGQGRAVAVDGFDVGGTPATSIVFAWGRVRSPQASGGSAALGDESGAALVLRFRGTSIQWTTARGPSEGRARIVLDGRQVGAFDGYATQAQFGVARTFGGLSDGVHTLRIVVVGTARRAATGTSVVVDGFEIG